MSQTVLAGDPRVAAQKSELLDAPKAKTGFSVHGDEFIAGTPRQVAEQIIEQCRATGAGHFLSIIGRGNGQDGAWMLSLFGKEVLPILRQA